MKQFNLVQPWETTRRSLTGLTILSLILTFSGSQPAWAQEQSQRSSRLVESSQASLESHQSALRVLAVEEQKRHAQAAVLNGQYVISYGTSTNGKGQVAISNIGIFTTADKTAPVVKVGQTAKGPGAIRLLSPAVTAFASYSLKTTLGAKQQQTWETLKKGDNVLTETYVNPVTGAVTKTNFTITYDPDKPVFKASDVQSSVDPKKGATITFVSKDADILRDTYVEFTTPGAVASTIVPATLIGPNTFQAVIPPDLLKAGAAYTYSVNGRDQAGNLGTLSNLTFKTPANFQAGSSTGLWTPQDLTYEGALRLPRLNTASTGTSFADGEIAYDPATNGFFVAGKVDNSNNLWVGEFGNTTFGMSTDVNQLPVASVLQPYSDVAVNAANLPSASKSQISGLLVENGKLLVASKVWYDANYAQRNTTSIEAVSTNLADTRSRNFNAIDTGSLGQGYAAGPMTAVPAQWRPVLGGSVMAGEGGSRFSIASTSSRGPAAFAFDPANLAVSGFNKVAATADVYYNPANPLAGDAWNVSSTLGANGATRMSGTAFFGNTFAVFGSTGVGAFFYGKGTTLLDPNGNPKDPANFVDPAASSKGSHAYPYVYTVWLYDAKSLAEVASGAKKPWEIKPYAYWHLNIDQLFSTGGNKGKNYQIGGVTMNGNELYVTVLGGDQTKQYQYNPLILKYKINTVNAKGSVQSSAQTFNTPKNPVQTQPATKMADAGYGHFGNFVSAFSQDNLVISWGPGEGQTLEKVTLNHEGINYFTRSHINKNGIVVTKTVAVTLDQTPPAVSQAQYHINANNPDQFIDVSFMTPTEPTSGGHVDILDPDPNATGNMTVYASQGPDRNGVTHVYLSADLFRNFKQGEKIQLIAKALDAAGNTGVSAPVTFTMPSPSTLPQSNSSLLTPRNLTYKGAFTLPVIKNQATSFNYGGSAFAYNPANNSLLVVGGDNQSVAEVGIPTTLGTDMDAEALPRAQELSPFVNLTKEFTNPVTSGGYDIAPGIRNPIRIGGLVVDGDKLVGSTYRYYDVGNKQIASHFTASLDLKDIQGAFTVGTGAMGTARSYAGPETLIPAKLQKLFGGKEIFTSQGANTNGSTGPSGFGFNPEDLSSTAPAPATTLLHYPASDPLGGNYKAGLYNNTSHVAGIILVPGQTAGSGSVLYFGDTGDGPIYYGFGTTVKDARGDTVDPFNGNKGFHVGSDGVHSPYQYRVWEYSVQDLADILSGKKQSINVKPYATWDLNVPFPAGQEKIGHHEILGVTEDAAHGKLYVAIAGGDRGANNPGGPFYQGPVIMVYDIKN